MENQPQRTQQDNSIQPGFFNAPNSNSPEIVRTYAIADTNPGKYPVCTTIWHPSIDIQATVASYWLTGFCDWEVPNE